MEPGPIFPNFDEDFSFREDFAAKNGPQARQSLRDHPPKRLYRTHHRAKNPKDKNITHHGLPTTRLANLPKPQAAARSKTSQTALHDHAAFRRASR
jgi:hypothetical protein